MWRSVLGLSACAAIWVVVSKKTDKPEIITHEENESKLKSVIQPYSVPWLLTNPIIMLIAGSISQSPLPPACTFSREIIPLADGGVIAVDWFQNENQTYANDAPVLVALHGITGHARVNYMVDLCKEATQEAWHIVCVNARGAGNSELATPMGFHAGKTDDIHEIIKHVRKKYPKSPIVGVGYSLGANVLAKYLGEYGEDSEISAAVVLGNPFDLQVSSKKLESSWMHKKLFDAQMATNLKRWLEPHRNMFTEIIDFTLLDTANTIREFDEHYILPVFPEFTDVDDYYLKCSSSRYLKAIKSPLLIIHSKDDPICPVEAIPDFSTSQFPNISRCFTNYGSHVCWLDSLNIYHRSSWAESTALRFLKLHITK